MSDGLAQLPRSGYWFRCVEVAENLLVGKTPTLDADFCDVDVTLVVGVDHVQCRQSAGRSDEGWSARRAQGDGQVVFVHFPFDEGAVPGKLLLGTAVAAVRAHLDAGGRVLIYDNRRTDRAALLAGSVLVAGGMDGFAAAHLLSTQGVLSFSGYIELLVTGELPAPAAVEPGAAAEGDAVKRDDSDRSLGA